MATTTNDILAAEPPGPRARRTLLPHRGGLHEHGLGLDVVDLAEGLAAVALDVHQRRRVGVLQAVLRHHATEVEPHGNHHRIGGRRGRCSTVTAATSFSNRQNASAVA